jgi:putative PIN family toxin of toxin-antitoxin system
MDVEKDTTVLDTNLILSSLISPRGPAGAAALAAFENDIVVQSPETLAELRRKLSSPKLQAFIDPDLGDLAFQAFANSVTVIDAAHNVELCRDKDDNKFLDLAIAARADRVVSGDRDLLTLKEVHGIGHYIPIVTPAKYVEHKTAEEPAPQRPGKEFGALLASMRMPKPH